MIRPVTPLPRAGLSAAAPPFPPGSVALLGAGPGCADLLTVRAAQRLAQADAVLYDHLIDAEILQLAPPSARRVCVGKRASRHTLPQAEINQLMIALARQGLRVARLKGGDPFMFGRGGEEMRALLAAGIRCEAVPGVSAALGAAASLALPLTHRDYAQGCRFVTGHRREGASALAWTADSGPDETVVVYMGLGEAAHIAEQLLSHGRAPDTPVAIVEQACMPGERCVCGRLSELGRLAEQYRLRAPALLIIGGVVRLHQELAALRAALGHGLGFLDPGHSAAPAAAAILRAPSHEYTP
ncbi:MULTISPECIES: uroporphyrinogen-III C-methyltransferase [Chromobacterium]|uniref:uroporphyrinogen-III C-methyltransferase n=1 Tax=Chromobacterium TaxID=535 RepID=UPI001D05E5CE|nr:MULTISPECIES: uroporphyrinogen-III C-methyltransferase [Chromobacterium]MCP1290212.1 uroporphyrinogen-III C-methyltransferase [Chromobacterium sp. S0633]